MGNPFNTNTITHKHINAFKQEVRDAEKSNETLHVAKNKSGSQAFIVKSSGSSRTHFWLSLRHLQKLQSDTTTTESDLVLALKTAVAKDIGKGGPSAANRAVPAHPKTTVTAKNNSGGYTMIDKAKAESTAAQFKKKFPQLFNNKDLLKNPADLLKTNAGTNLLRALAVKEQSTENVDFMVEAQRVEKTLGSNASPDAKRKAFTDLYDRFVDGGGNDALNFPDELSSSVKSFAQNPSRFEGQHLSDAQKKLSSLKKEVLQNLTNTHSRLATSETLATTVQSMDLKTINKKP